MSLHLAKSGSPLEAICGGNAARTTTDVRDERINCNRCLDMLGQTQLSKAMIHRASSRVLARACWSCGKSDTYCDGLYDQREGDCCCPECAVARHNTHTGLPHVDVSAPL